MRRLSVLIIIALLLNILIGGTVFANNICQISASFNPSNPIQGQELEITISAKDITEGISVVSFTLDYDSSVFEFTGVEKNDGWTISQTESLITIITDDYNATTKAGNIGKIKLKVNDNATLGNTLIKLTSIEVVKEDATIVSIGEVSQDITIKQDIITPSEDTNTTNITGETNTTNTTEETNTTNTTEETNITNTTEETNSTNTIEVTNMTNTTNIRNNNATVETKNTESKNSNLPYTGNAIKGMGILLLIITFSIISYKKYFKYKNI